MIFFNGANGSLGRYFADAARDADVPATELKSRLEDLSGFASELAAAGTPEAATFVHFAAKVSVPWCEAHPEETRKTNVTDTVAATRLFTEWCAGRKIPAKIIYVSSAHLYARNDGVIGETDSLLPRSVYAKTKLEAENALRVLCKELDADLRIARVFGLVAPVQPENYILHAVLKRAREKRLSDIPGLSNLRDYLDSRDVCRSLVKLDRVPAETFARVCPDGILNLASGKGRSIRSIVELALSAIYEGGEAKALAAKITEAPARVDDVPNIVGSTDRYLALFGEYPRQIALETTIADALAARP
jgi:nucleoside-diphosphate-sugar epimerase